MNQACWSHDTPHRGARGIVTWLAIFRFWPQIDERLGRESKEKGEESVKQRGTLLLSEKALEVGKLVIETQCDTKYPHAESSEVRVLEDKQ